MAEKSSAQIAMRMREVRVFVAQSFAQAFRYLMRKPVESAAVHKLV